MKIDEFNKPVIYYKRNGDGSWTARIETGDQVSVHSNKDLTRLEKLVKERFGTSLGRVVANFASIEKAGESFSPAPPILSPH